MEPSESGRTNYLSWGILPCRSRRRERAMVQLAATPSSPLKAALEPGEEGRHTCVSPDDQAVYPAAPPAVGRSLAPERAPERGAAARPSSNADISAGWLWQDDAARRLAQLER